MASPQFAGFLIEAERVRRLALPRRHPTGLTPMQRVIVLHLHLGGAQPQQALAREFASSDGSSLSAELRVLLRKGYVDTHALPSNRRRRQLRLSASGRRQALIILDQLAAPELREALEGLLRADPVRRRRLLAWPSSLTGS